VDLNHRPRPYQRSVDWFYNNLQDRGDCQTTRKSCKTSHFVGWVVGWKKSTDSAQPHLRSIPTNSVSAQLQTVRELIGSVNTSAFLRTNPTGDSYLSSCPITSSKWSKKYQSIMLDVRPEWQDTRSLSEAECQFGRLSFFKNAANRGSLCKLFSSGCTFVYIKLGSRWA